MRIGYCSPFNPMKSGVSDFSEELVVALNKYAEVVLFSPVKLDNCDLIKTMETHNLSELHNENLRNTLDVIVYQVGNNKRFHGEIVDMLLQYPGVLEIHDFGMHHLAAEKYYLDKGPEAYLEEVIYCHGEYGGKIARNYLTGNTKAPWETHGLSLCMNRRYIEAATAVIVHSESAKQMALAIRPGVAITNIMLHTEMETDAESWRRKCRQKLKIDDNTIVTGSFGFATSAKRILPILNALKRYKDNKNSNFLYYIVGEPQKELKLKNVIAEFGLKKNVVVTGFTNLEDFKVYMGACDFCLNLRYPTQGESSASLHRMLGMGKPVIVTDIGTFSDYPDTLAIKVRYDENEEDDVYHAICTMTESNFSSYREAALAFAKENCDIDKNASRYKDFFEKVISNRWQPDYCDTVIERLCELSLTDEAYVEHIGGIMDHLGLL